MTIKVFLADDHAVLRDGLRSLLEAQGDITVVGESDNGRDAVREMEELLPDVVVMDIAMPDLNGIEATRIISDRWPGVRVVMLSVFSDAESIYRALQAGASGYLLKSSAGREVVEAVRTVHLGGRYLSDKITETVVDEYVRERQAKSPLETLSPRERQVLQLSAEGKTIPEIAELLSLSPRTVETYRARLMEKLGIKDLRGLIMFAVKHGITPIE